MTVGLVLVSHSRDLANGLADLAGQMAPEVVIAPVGGDGDGNLGTSFEGVMAALERADTGDGAVLLYDLGSAEMTAQTALEFLEPEQVARIRVVDAPLVEAAVAAAVTATGGADLDEVVRAAESARGAPGSPPAAEPTAGVREAGTGALTADVEDRIAVDDRAQARATLRNPLGLHARPAAALVRSVARFPAQVELAGHGSAWVDVRSVLRVVALALRGGDEVALRASGPAARAALDAVVALIGTGFGEVAPNGTAAADAVRPSAPSGPVRGPVPDAPGIIRGVGGSVGLVLGPVRRLQRRPEDLSTLLGPADGATPVDVQEQARRLDSAIAEAAALLAVGTEFQAAHAVLVQDPDLRTAAAARLADGAERAWWTAVTGRAAAMAADPDEFVAARAVDVLEAGAAVLDAMGLRLDRVPASLDGAVVVTEDIGPAEVPVVAERGAAALVLARGSITAHAVIVARGLGLPMVLRAGGRLAALIDGSPVVVDGAAGTIEVDPDGPRLTAVRARIEAHDRLAEEQRSRAREPVVLPDGRPIRIMANIGSVTDARAACRFGADGVGLLRTELLVLDRAELPSEDRQAADLAELLDAAGTGPAIIRVLDAGGDKPVPALDLDPARNGFLGLRGLRYLLANPSVLHTQLRAICRAGVGHRVSVMAPMVTVAQEMLAFRTAVDEAVASLVADGVDHRRPERIGAMVEVPAAALAADEICAVSDFISIGTNDLTGYLAAADRTLPSVADLLDPGSTAMRRLLDTVCEMAVASGTELAVCGEMAGTAQFARELIDRGVQELSMAPARIPVIKELLRAQA
ncbi:dihydroxyacetone kinase phosphoryl donor subunit DhaM [Nakamurella leprariae]|uniref:Phosphocarrier protein HPr n=1 Tax=Nakamurella leprariae TaxID=2803911 RepID=A0A939BW64_9ACTN|nr:dihydroxyacetone kinase phosphoryl donor subunit DhaM [Nakamurella leprariae]MBM9467228.1 PTS-dependent dihydroxyacetone kinase phosphotransferase subunit DhaM [Nakamurella leprariae]